MRRKPNKEQEVLHSTVNLSGEGEDPVVKALVSDQFVKGTNQEATDIALALQQLVRGQSALLENQTQFSEQISKLRQRMDEMDKTAQRWETDRENFVQEVLDRAEKLRASDMEKDKIIARGSQQFSDAIAKARAEQTVEQQKFAYDLEHMPKVTVVSAGELVMVVENGRSVPKMMNEVVKIKNRRWVLPIGKAVEVPMVVAQVLDERRRLQEETAARERVLSANVEDKTLDKSWKQINEKYNSTTDVFPTA